MGSTEKERAGWRERIRHTATEGKFESLEPSDEDAWAGIPDGMSANSFIPSLDSVGPQWGDKYLAKVQAATETAAPAMDGSVEAYKLWQDEDNGTAEEQRAHDVERVGELLKELAALALAHQSDRQSSR